MFDGLIDHLGSRGDDPAVLTTDRILSYRELADQVAASASDLGSRRRLVLLETHNDTATLVHYLAALAGGHVVLPLPADADHAAVIAAYDPDVIVRDGSVSHRHRAAHDLHPELALLLSTSGSTGSPKLVRLSRTNLAANADAIATYLDIRHTDRAATTLPMSYCYGLSVVHSHLLRGAGLILTDHSVVDDEFWDLVARHRGTSFAGVPHTFDLLDRIGFDDMALPHLRHVTQAGGRLAADHVRRLTELGRRRGWQLFVMYGATEATARMSYLPPEIAHDNPRSIGVPIPGGTFDIEPIDGMPDDVGELIYHGPNVMMGYAHDHTDLAAGRTVDALRTGDLARRSAGGLYEVVGRISRFAKMYGLRIDRQQRRGSRCAQPASRRLCTDGDGASPHRRRRDRRGRMRRPAVVAAGGSGSTARSAVRVHRRRRDPSACPRGSRTMSSACASLRASQNRRLSKPTQDALDLRALFAEVLQTRRC